METQSILIIFLLVVLFIVTLMISILLCYRIDSRVAATSTTGTATSTIHTNTIGSMILAEREKDVQEGLHPAVVEAFPLIPYKSIKTLKNVKARHGCAVCLSEFEDQDMLRMLPGCCHVFHPDCIGAWLVSNNTCPICRSDLSDPMVLTSDHCLIGEEKEPVVTEMKELENDERLLRRASSMAVRWPGRSGRWDALIKTLSGRWTKEGDSRRIMPLVVDSIDSSPDVEMGIRV